MGKYDFGNITLRPTGASQNVQKSTGRATAPIKKAKDVLRSYDHYLKHSSPKGKVSPPPLIGETQWMTEKAGEGGLRVRTTAERLVEPNGNALPIQPLRYRTSFVNDKNDTVFRVFGTPQDPKLYENPSAVKQQWEDSTAHATTFVAHRDAQAAEVERVAGELEQAAKNTRLQYGQPLLRERNQALSELAPELDNEGKRIKHVKDMVEATDRTSKKLGDPNRSYSEKGRFNETKTLTDRQAALADARKDLEAPGIGKEPPVVTKSVFSRKSKIMGSQGEQTIQTTGYRERINSARGFSKVGAALGIGRKSKPNLKDPELQFEDAGSSKRPGDDDILEVKSNVSSDK